MSKNNEFPPAVTKNSSKSKLWEELEASRDEIDQQQAVINGLRERVVKLKNENLSLRHQHDMITAVLRVYKYEE